jgi:hypothetical protein
MISQIFGDWMRNILLVLVSITFFWLTGCQNSTPTHTAIAEPTTADIIPVSQQIAGSENYCVSCHTDQEQLISTAKPEEVVESESSGAG